MAIVGGLPGGRHPFCRGHALLRSLGIRPRDFRRRLEFHHGQCASLAAPFGSITGPVGAGFWLLGGWGNIVDMIWFAVLALTYKGESLKGGSK